MDELSYAVKVVPAIVGLVQIIKNAGMPTNYAPLLAVICGVVVGVAGVFTNSTLSTTLPGVVSAVLIGAGTGVILGLAAAQAYQQAGTIGDAIHSRLAASGVTAATPDTTSPEGKAA